MPERPAGAIHHVDFGGSGPDIVLVHGLGGSHLNWDLLAPRLTAHGHVLALDLPGFGLSAPSGRAATVDRNVGVLEAFVRTRTRPPVVLVGNSMGGLVAVLLAARSPGLVRGLVLLDPALPAPSRVLRSPAAAVELLLHAVPGVGERVRAARRRRRGPRRTVHDTLRLCGVDPARLPPDLVERSVALAAGRFDVAGMDRAFLSASRSLAWALLRARRYRTARRAVRVPVLLLHGDRDALVPVSAARAVAAQHPAWRYVELPGAGHLPQLQEPATVARLVGGWLDGLPGESAAADGPAARDGTGEGHGHAGDEAEVVPAAGVAHLVDADGVGEQRHDEGDRQDQAVPQAEPEPGGLRHGDELRIRSGGAPDQ
ncbi:alpha/beta fold hydrolase [Pseudonocardia abyssalis]|uniref:alpha/beta fold hydrolase n=1 Tax=Pseudonocardia abyssalis TaxID=2792008 RepID=UPI001C49F9E4|nr:alpha/beta hydrolase [Pseudonocardia abyssalis]